MWCGVAWREVTRRDATRHDTTLGCDIQGFRAMGLSVQYWPRWFQDFPAIWLAAPFGANGSHLGICTLPEWWQIVPMQESTNEWKKLTLFQIMGLAETQWYNLKSEVPIDKINIAIWKYSRTWQISFDSILNFLTRYKCIVIKKDSWINIHECFGRNFPTWNIRNVWRARDDGHHYDVTSKCCGVTITTRLVEWVLSIYEIRVFCCGFQELSVSKNIQMVTQIKCEITAKRHGRSVLLRN